MIFSHPNKILQIWQSIDKSHVAPPFLHIFHSWARNEKKKKNEMKKKKRKKKKNKLWWKSITTSEWIVDVFTLLINFVLGVKFTQFSADTAGRRKKKQTMVCTKRFCANTAWLDYFIHVFPQWVLPELIAHSLITVLLLVYFQWIFFLLNVPLAGWHIYRLVENS